jgi:hypothetical protein
MEYNSLLGLVVVLIFASFGYIDPEMAFAVTAAIWSRVR